MENGDEMSEEMKEKFKIQKRAYDEIGDIRKELEELRKKFPEADKKPLAPAPKPKHIRRWF